jgi:hypothetical protein
VSWRRAAYDVGMSGVDDLCAEFEAAGVELVALYGTLPPRATEQAEPYVNGRGEQVEAHRGWTDDERARVAVLRDRERQLAVVPPRRLRRAAESSHTRADGHVAPPVPEPAGHPDLHASVPRYPAPPLLRHFRHASLIVAALFVLVTSSGLSCCRR